MAGNSALGGFVEGLQGGITHRRDTLRNKKIDRMLDQKAELGDMEIYAIQDDVNAVRAQKGLDPMDFSQFAADQDPYGMKLTDFFKPKKMWQNIKDNFGFGGGGAMPGADPAAANQQAIGAMTGGARASSMGVQGNNDSLTDMYAANGGPVRKYAEGGSIESQLDALDRTRRPNPAGVESQLESQMTAEQRARMEARRNPSRAQRAINTTKSAAGKVGRAAGKAAAIVTPTVMAGSAIQSGLTDTEEYRRRYEGLPLFDFLKSEKDDSELTTTLKDVGYRTIGTFQDLGDTLLNPGRLFSGGDEGPVAPDRRAAIDVAAQPTDRTPPTNAGPTAPTAPTPRQQAVPPTNGPDQLLSPDSPIAMPDDMPTMNTEEWVAYRAANVENLLLRGMTLPEAHDAITSMQQQGFLNYGTQALQLLAAGDAPRAAMALKAAYQYFPNGVDVRFGITKDAAGQPALVAMGIDEKTGEPVQQGPMVLNGERLAVMMENMTNPDAFRMWTKDWRSFEQDLRKYYELEKPQAESENIYRDRMGKAALMRSEADLYGVAAGGGGLKQSDLDRAYGEMDKILADYGLYKKVSQEDLNYLRRIAGIAYESDPGNYPDTIGNIIALYSKGGTEAVDQAIRSGG